RVACRLHGESPLEYFIAGACIEVTLDPEVAPRPALEPHARFTPVLVGTASAAVTASVAITASVATAVARASEVQPLRRTRSGGELEDVRRGRRPSWRPAPKIGLISLTGPVSRDPGSYLEAIVRAADDDQIAALVVRLDSPGGDLRSASAIAHALRALD